MWRKRKSLEFPLGGEGGVRRRNRAWGRNKCWHFVFLEMRHRGRRCAVDGFSWHFLTLDSATVQLLIIRAFIQSNTENKCMTMTVVYRMGHSNAGHASTPNVIHVIFKWFYRQFGRARTNKQTNISFGDKRIETTPHDTENVFGVLRMGRIRSKCTRTHAVRKEFRTEGWMRRVEPKRHSKETHGERWKRHQILLLWNVSGGTKWGKSMGMACKTAARLRVNQFDIKYLSAG